MGFAAPPPLYYLAIAGALCRAKLLPKVAEAGQHFQAAAEDGAERLKILRRENKVNTMLTELLNDPTLRKRIKELMGGG